MGYDYGFFLENYEATCGHLISLDRLEGIPGRSPRNFRVNFLGEFRLTPGNTPGNTNFCTLVCSLVNLERD